jgi:hypothetical protein
MKYSQLIFREMEEIMANVIVSPAEVEKFKLEKMGEREFTEKLVVLVRELEAKVSERNPVLRSMKRFLKGSL